MKKRKVKYFHFESSFCEADRVLLTLLQLQLVFLSEGWGVSGISQLAACF